MIDQGGLNEVIGVLPSKDQADMYVPASFSLVPKCMHLGTRRETAFTLSSLVGIFGFTWHTFACNCVARALKIPSLQEAANSR